MTTAALPPGTAVGRFEIRSLLGRGGMGEVYKAWDPTLQRHVALKILPPELVENEGRLARFIQEARSASALNHPHIVTIHDIGETTLDGRAVRYIAMELVEGATLREHIHVQRTSVDRLVALLIQTAEGLAKAHAAGIVHRDLKPENVLVTTDGFAKIIDFGLAKLIEPRVSASRDSDFSTLQKTGELAIVGTVGYMSPEQVEARPADHRSDVFSFGCMLYESVTRRKPFAGDSKIDTLHKILHEEPPPPGPDVSPELRRVIQRCLAKRPEERYQSASDVAADLREAIRHDPPSTSRWLRPAVLAAAGLVVIALAALTGRGREAVPIEPPRIESIAVLPLQNLSGKEAEEYFVNGITEGITTELARTGTVKVISRTSAKKSKNSGKSLREIARELNVDAIVEGSAVRDAQRVRIHLQLIDPVTSQLLWADQDEQDIRNVLAMQRELSIDLVRAIAGKSSVQHARRPAPKAVEPVALDLYLQGLHLSDISPFDRVPETISLFEKAVEIDPTFAPAHAALARKYLLASATGSVAVTEACLNARAAAERASLLDETLAEAHAALGFLKWACDRDWTGSGHYFRRALELNPNDANTLVDYSIYLDLIGESDNAIRTALRAVELDPLGHRRWSLGVLYFYAGRYDEAIAEYEKVLLIQPQFAHMHRLIAAAYTERGLHSEAIATAEKALEIVTTAAPREVVGYRASLGTALAAAGEHLRAHQILAALENENPGHPGRYWISGLHAALGEEETALRLLKEELAQGSWATAASVWRDPLFSPLRADPRWHALMKRFGFPPEVTE